MKFEEMIWLFTSNPSSRGIARLNIGEAALLWRHCSTAKVAILEIGRRHGGSTCLIAASNPQVPLTSVDIRDEMNPRCEEFLSQKNGRLIKGDSRTMLHDCQYDVAFIDGDHSYEGVKQDFENVRPFLTKDAAVIFHDAAKGGAGTCKGVERFVEEALGSGEIEVLETVDSMMACRVLEKVPSRKLTIGMLTYDDFDGVYFSLQSIRLHHPEIMKDVEFLILDNNPSSEHGKQVKSLCPWIKDATIRYVPVTDKKSTSLRDRIFKMARTPFVLSMDCHVLFQAGALSRLIEFMEADDGNLLQGPMLYDNLEIGATHMEPTWRDGMKGIWAIDDRGLSLDSPPFEIPAHGLGVFACRKDAWKGFNERFKGFGGEECYIHEKFRRAGKKTLCLPFLRWLHRFQRPNGIPYKPCWEDRVWNYSIGYRELGMDTSEIVEAFSSKIPRATVERIILSSS